ncbi:MULTISPECIES: hypothetical protein [Pantoea]|uniref:hypothetical protein n=1 Tax=Pantoea TaxID=53335 RepID=UPI001F1610ED|nr:MULTISPECIES: hypothetical protein [Pantoea]
MEIAKNGSDIADVAEFLKNLGLGEGAKMPAASAMMNYAGWVSIPIVIDGEQRNFILQWKQVTVPKSPDGSMQTVNSSWLTHGRMMRSRLVSSMLSSLWQLLRRAR